MTYFNELNKSMNFLSKKNHTIFLGQAVAEEGTAISNTLKDVSKNKLFELPVMEESQMGFSIGLAFAGFVPITIYPRWNFLLLAINQLVNHLDKINKISNGVFCPKVIIRTSVGSVKPLHPQDQHVGDFTDSIKKMCTNIEIIQLKKSSDILKSYKKAYSRKDKKSTLLVEYADFYNLK